MTDKEEATVVCARLTDPLIMPDNLTGKCCMCSSKVQFRPHAPEGKRMCSVCAADLIDPGDKIDITAETIEDLKTFMRKRRQ